MADKEKNEFSEQIIETISHATDETINELTSNKGEDE